MEKRMKKIIGLLKLELGSNQARLTNSNDSTSIQACSSRATIKEEVENDNGNASSTTLFNRLCVQSFFVQIALLRIRSSNPYAYALNLLHSMFTQEELAGLLLFKSKKSGCSKPGLVESRNSLVSDFFLELQLQHRHCCVLP